MQIVEIGDPADPRLADYRDLTDVALRRVLEPDGRPLHRGVDQGDRSRPGCRPPPALGAGAAEVAARGRRPCSASDADTPVYVVPAEVAESLTGYAVHRGALAAMHRPPLRVRRRGRRGRANRRHPRGHRRSHQRRRGLPQRRGPRRGRRAHLAALRRPAVPPQRAGEHGHGLPGAVDAAAGVARGARGCSRDLGFHLAALALADGAVALDEFAADRPERVALLLGAEGDGLSRRALQAADTVVTIPMARRRRLAQRRRGRRRRALGAARARPEPRCSDLLARRLVGVLRPARAS